MIDSVRKRVRVPVAVLVGVAVVGLIAASAAFAQGHRSHANVVCKRVGKHKLSCPKKELHGKRGKSGAAGPQGQQGPVGPAGAAGPPGPAGVNGISIPLIFRGQIPTQNTPILNLAGLLVNASCGPTEAATSLTGVSEIAGSILRATDVVSGAISWSNSTFVNERFSLTPGGAQNNYVLTYLAGNGSTIMTADYGIANGGMSLVNVSCAVFGTVHLAAG
jgi:hypothetical protein